MVGKSAWNIFFLLCLFAILATHGAPQPSVRLSVTSDQGVALKQVAAGKPFIVEVSLTGIRNSGAINIGGIDNFTVEKQSMRMAIINGASTARHTYSVIIDEPGIYRLGPVEVDDAGTVYRSPVIAVRVGEGFVEDAAAAATKKRKESSKKALLQVSCDKHTVVVGEKFTCYVRFLFSRDNISLQQIQVPNFEFIEEKKSGPTSGKQVLDGISYDYLEWTWEFIARDAGKKRITGFTADYIQQQQDDINHTNIMSDFHRLFHGFADKKRINAPPISIIVHELPPFQQEVKAVGLFSRLDAFVDASIAKEGDGLVLTLELEGEGNMRMLDSLPLSAIPQGLKAYPSKAYLVPGYPTRKRFEYVLQAVQRGIWEIPPQDVYYFDVDERVYKKLTSKPISLEILAQQEKSAQALSPRSDESTAATKNTITEDQELAPICMEYFYRIPAQWEIPWWLFVIFIVAPLIGVVYLLSMPFLQKWISYSLPSIKRRSLYVKLWKKLDVARKHADPGLLREIFIDLFAYQMSKNPDEITQDDMENFLVKSECTEKQRAEWHLFWHELDATLFSATKSPRNTTHLYTQARVWLKVFERCFDKELL